MLIVRTFALYERSSKVLALLLCVDFVALAVAFVGPVRPIFVPSNGALRGLFFLDRNQDWMNFLRQLAAHWQYLGQSRVY